MAIYNPAELDFGNDEKFSMIIYGAPGVGKSTLAASAPKPVLFDLDRGIRRVKAQHRPATSLVNTYEELLADMESPAMADFETIIIDTGGALINLMKEFVKSKDSVNRTKSGSISQKGYGAVKDEFSRLTDWLKLTLRKNIIYVFHTVEEKNKDIVTQRLLCDGSAKNIVWQPCDFGAYLYKDGNQTVAGFSPTEEYFAKGCYGVSGVVKIPFGETVPNNFLTKLFEHANKTLAADREYFDAEREKYEAAMEEGKKLIDAIKTPTDASQVGNDMKNINHCLTSLAELRQIFKDKLKDLGIVWDSVEKRYKFIEAEKPADKPKKAPKAAEKPKKGQEAEEAADGAEKPDSAPETPKETENAETAEKPDSQSEADAPVSTGNPDVEGEK